MTFIMFYYKESIVIIIIIKITITIIIITTTTTTTTMAIIMMHFIEAFHRYLDKIISTYFRIYKLHLITTVSFKIIFVLNCFRFSLS